MTIALYDLVGRDAERPFSPHCWKVRMALAHKGLPFHAVPVRFEEIAAVEGGGGRTLPVIRDGDRVVQDSFAIAEYLDESYPDRPALFGEPGGRGLARFVESWSQRTIHPAIVATCILDIHAAQDESNAEWFRTKREASFGKSLEAVQSGRSPERLAAFRASLEPLRAVLKRQPFIAGEAPMFADYIVFGAFQWARVVSSFALLESQDPVASWFGRCLDLHDGAGRAVPAAG